MTAKTAMQQRRLGKTSIMVSPIGLGVMQFSGGSGVFNLAFPRLTQDRKNAIIKAALDGGINWFDSAEMYGLGRSERSLSAALKAARAKDKQVIIATKWLPLLRSARNIPRSIENRLRCLDGYTIDLYMVHQPWSLSSPEAEMDAMADLVVAGKIRSVGVSNFSAERMRRAHQALEKRGLPLAVNQMEYSLLNRKIETDGVLEAAKELGVTIIAYTPLANGLLSGAYHQHPTLLQAKPVYHRVMIERQIERTRFLIEALEEIAPRYQVTPAQVALNWAINFQGETVVAIPGASKVYQAEQAAGAMNFRLSDEELAQLDHLSQTYR
ncbi:MAG TPA: aldo/keto reductase [Anaerolineales bacterium]|nr:aldo/keto reductase [Anaerolineales bacterium]